MTCCSDKTKYLPRPLPGPDICHGSAKRARNVAIGQAKSLRLVFTAAAGLFMIGSAYGEQNLPTISKPPSELMVAAMDYPWSAVGKFNNGVFGFCTAVLISDDYALTAAHCLYFRLLRHFLPPESLHFVLGYESQHLGKHFHVVAYYIPPSYNPRKALESIASDWALLRIASDTKPQTQPLPVAHAVNLAVEMPVMTAGYSKLTPHKMTADKACRIVGRSDDDAIIFDSCHSPEGFSGGPILAAAPDGGVYSVLGIHVGSQVWQGKGIAIAVSAAAIWPEIRSCVEEHECKFQYFARNRDPTAAEILAGLPNLGLQKVIDIVTDRFCHDENAQCGLPFANSLGERSKSDRRELAPAAGE